MCLHYGTKLRDGASCLAVMDVTLADHAWTRCSNLLLERLRPRNCASDLRNALTDVDGADVALAHQSSILARRRTGEDVAADSMRCLMREPSVVAGFAGERAGQSPKAARKMLYFQLRIETGTVDARAWGVSWRRARSNSTPYRFSILRECEANTAQPKPI